MKISNKDQNWQSLTLSTLNCYRAAKHIFNDHHLQDCHYLHTCYVAAEHLLQDADESELEVSVGHCVDHRVERRVEITFDVDKCTSVFFEY